MQIHSAYSTVRAGTFKSDYLQLKPSIQTMLVPFKIQEMVFLTDI